MATSATRTRNNNYSIARDQQPSLNPAHVSRSLTAPHSANNTVQAADAQRALSPEIPDSVPSRSSLSQGTGQPSYASLEPRVLPTTSGTHLFGNRLSKEGHHSVRQSSRGAEVETSQDSDPVRPAKRKRRAHPADARSAASSSSPPQGPTKRARRKSSVAGTRPPACTTGDDSSTEGEASGEEAAGLGSDYRTGIPSVEVTLPADFDRNAYTYVSAFNTQSTTATSSQEDPLTELPPPSTIRRKVIPDSQDSLDPSTYSSPAGANFRQSLGSQAHSSPAPASQLRITSAPLEIPETQFSTASLGPSAQPDFGGYYPINSQLPSTSSSLLPTNPCQGQPSFGHSTVSEVSETPEASYHSRRGTQTIVPGTIAPDTLRQSQALASIGSRTSGLICSQEERVSETDRSSTPTGGVQSYHIEQLTDSGSSEQWQAAQIVAPVDLSELQQPVTKFSTDTSPANLVQDHGHSANSLDSGDIDHPRQSGRDQLSRSSRDSHLSQQEAEAMDDPGVDWKARAKAAREKARAELLAKKRSSREATPSQSATTESHSGRTASSASTHSLPVRESVPSIAVPPSTIEETPVVEQMQEDYAIVASPSPSSPPSPPSMERIVFLPIPAMVRSIYKTELQRNKATIIKFLEQGEADPAQVDPELLREMQEMVERLKFITDHQDLAYNMSSSQQSLDESQTVKWATTCSSKFLFLQHLFRYMQGQVGEIAVMARSEQLLDILELMLKHDGHEYNRFHSPTQPRVMSPNGLVIQLLAPNSVEAAEITSRAIAAVAFDDASLRFIRLSQAAGLPAAGPRPIVIPLTVAYSPTHVDWCLTPDSSPIKHLVEVIRYTAGTRNDLGQLPPNFPSPEEAAADVAAALLRKSGEDVDWPLRSDLSVLDLGPPNTFRPSDASMNGVFEASSVAEPNALQQAIAQPALKRALRAESIGETDAENSKRMRMTPVLGEASLSGSVFPLPGETSDARATAEEAIANMDALDSVQDQHIAQLIAALSEAQTKNSEFERQMKAKVENEERLKHLVADLEKQKQDLSETLRVLGPNYSKAIEDKGKAEAGREAVVRRADKLDQLVQTRVQELLKAKEEKAALETELAAARAAISNSSVPEAAALVQAEDKIKSLEEENSKLTKKADSVQNTLNYIQDAYQKQSSHLTELQSELQDLTRENEILKRQASDNKVKIAEIQGKYATEQLNERIDELEAQLRETVRDRDKTKEELRIRTNGRRETRGTSIPRSPAMGNSASGTMSPRQGPQFVGRAGGGSNSRGSSPAPGDSFGRDPPLFPGGHPPSRLSSMPYGIN